MPEAKRPLKVFLSYASQDKPVVRELSERLAREGWIDPWVDEKKLLPGQDWRTKIEEAVETSDIVFVCLSDNSVTKEGFVQKELRYAREIAFEKPDETIFLIPLRLDDCTVPRGLRFYQWGDYFGEKKEETYEALLESLKLRYEQKLKLEAKERAQREKAEQERIALEERARKESEEKTRLKAEERARREREERERKNAEAKERKEAEEKAYLEAEARARIEKEEKDRKAAELAAQEKEQRETAEKNRREKAERDAAEKARQQKAKRDAAEKAKRERIERFSIWIALIKRSLSNFIISLKSIQVSAKPFFWGVGIIFVIALGLLMNWLEFPFRATELQSATPSVTATSTITLVPSSTSTPNMLSQILTGPAWTKTNTPTITPTSTRIPPESFLFQKDFEDGLTGELQISSPGIWAVEQELDGNHSLCGAGQVWYRDRRTVWTDYAFETRVKFVRGNWLTIVFRHDLESNEQYQLVLDEYNGLGLMQSWRALLGRNFAWSPNRDRWQIFKVEIKGDILSIYQDEQLLKVLTLQPPMANHGGIGYLAGDAITTDKICFDDIKVWSLK